jgi:undecaprenyl-diphosphatase
MKILRCIKKLFNTPFFSLMLGIFAAAFFGWVFSEVAEDIWINKETFPFDQATKAWMVDGQNPIGMRIFSTLTLLGSFKWLAILMFSMSGYLLYQKQYQKNLILLGGFALTSISVTLFKILSNRSRPYSELSLLENTMSFPSGHMAHSLFVYGFLGYLLSKYYKRKFYSIWFMLFGISLAGMIGLSRLYLGLHWLSDILGGFTLAAAYLCLSIGLLEYLHNENS